MIVFAAVHRCERLLAAVVWLAGAIVLPLRLHAQPSGDTVRLADLQRLAERYDPRAGQGALLRAQTNARRETIRRERLPALNVTGSAQYLSDVASVGTLPGIGPVGPLNHQYDAYVTLRQPLVDPTRASRDRLETERLAEAEAGVRATLYRQRLAVNDAYFAALQHRVRQQVLRAGIDDLSNRQKTAALRVDAGTALPSELLLIDAELVRRRQSLVEAEAEEQIALSQLTSLTGLTLSSATVLSVPTTTSALSSVNATSKQRPEYAEFDRSMSVLQTRIATLNAMDRPRLSLVTRTGYGRPGLNALGREFDRYVSTGIQLEWTPWNWGATRREREVLKASEANLRLNEAVFTRSLSQAVTADSQRLQVIERLTADDDAVVALRERVLTEARLRYDEGELTAVDYLARANEHLVAQLDRETRRIRLAETRVRYLTTIGQELP